MGRRNLQTLDQLIDRLAMQVGKTALDLKGEDKFPDKLDALKALTTLKSVKSKGQPEPEGGGINEFAKLFGADRSDGAGGHPGHAEADDDDPEYDPTETNGIDAGVSGDLDGAGGAAASADPGGERHRDGVDRD